MRPRCVNLFRTLGVCLVVSVAGQLRAESPGSLHVEGQQLVPPAQVRPDPNTSQPELPDDDPIPPWGRALPGAEPALQDIAPTAERTRRPPMWLNVEYLLWWTRNTNVPPLVTRGELSDPVPGALGQPYTKILYGGDKTNINFEDRHGGRFTFGMPIDADGVYGIEASYLFLTARAVGAAFSSPGSPVLAQPFFNTLTHAEDSSLVTYPGLIEGSISVRSTSFLDGAEANGTVKLWDREGMRLAVLTGFRYLSLHEDLQVNDLSNGVAQLPPLPPPAPGPGAFFVVQDRFATWNDFYGGQLGLKTDLQYRRLQFQLFGKVAIGDTRELSQIAGHTYTNYPTLLDVPAGLYALSSNSGRFARNAFTVVPEVGTSLGLRITDRLSLHAGYNFLYWNQVARPGSQIDLDLNPHLIPTSTSYGIPGGPARPAAGVRSSDFWAQGLTVGLVLER